MDLLLPGPLVTRLQGARADAPAPLRAGNCFCPRTHTPLNDWICVRSNDALRERIAAWAERTGIDLEALIAAHYAKAATP